MSNPVGPCKYCENIVALSAKRCPNCGGKNPYGAPSRAPEIILVVVVLGAALVLLVVFAFIVSTSEDKFIENAKVALPE